MKVTWHEPKPGEPPFSLTVEAYDPQMFIRILHDVVEAVVANWDGLSRLAHLSPTERREVFEGLEERFGVHKKTAATGASAGDGLAGGTAGDGESVERSAPSATTVAPAGPARGGERPENRGDEGGDR